MELRFADDEKKENSESGLKLSETNHQQMEKEDNGVPNPWDFNVESEPVVISSISSTVQTDTVETKKDQEGRELVLKIGMIVVYVCFILNIASIAWICTQETSSLMENQLKFQGLYTATTIICIVDAILVNILYERKISLVFVAWFLGFLYPVIRNKHVNGRSGMGGWCCFGTLIAFLFLVAYIFKGFSMYGNILVITDEETRTQAVALMDQTMEDGRRLGDKIMKNVRVEEAVIQKEGRYTCVGLLGEGRVKIDGDAFMDTGTVSVETQLAFVKEGNGEYQLQAVVLDGTEMTSYGAKSYWNSVICR